MATESIKYHNRMFSRPAKNARRFRRLTIESLENRRVLAGPIDTLNRNEVEIAYVGRYSPAISTPVVWTGNTAGCVAGTINQAATDATLDTINFFRNMSGVNDVVLDENYSRKAQQAALMMQAQNALSHTPTEPWACYTTEGAEAARNSNLYLGVTGPSSIKGYIEDPGDGNTAAGHRRWIQYPFMDRIGSGSTSNANALWVFAPFVNQHSPDWVAWPPAGYVTQDLVFPRWSLSRADADFSSASVAMTFNGNKIGLRTNAVQNGFGLDTLVWEPTNLVLPSDGTDATVKVAVSNVFVNGVSQNFQYDVIAIKPPTGALSIELANQSIPENAGVVANFVTLSRIGGDMTRALQVTLASSDESEAIVPQFVTLPAGVAQIRVALTAVNDSTIDGDQLATITATANEFSTVSKRLVVSDDDRQTQPSPWHNVANRFDVNQNGLVTPLDALLVINSLRRLRTNLLPVVRTGSYLIDVDNNNFVTPLDALLIINFISRRTRGGEGEPELLLDTSSLASSDSVGWFFEGIGPSDELNRSSRAVMTRRIR